MLFNRPVILKIQYFLKSSDHILEQIASVGGKITAVSVEHPVKRWHAETNRSWFKQVSNFTYMEHMFDVEKLFFTLNPRWLSTPSVIPALHGGWDNTMMCTLCPVEYIWDSACLLLTFVSGDSIMRMNVVQCTLIPFRTPKCQCHHVLISKTTREKQ